MTVKLLTEHNLEFISLKWGCTGLSESTHVKIPHCRKSNVVAHIIPSSRDFCGLLINFANSLDPDLYRQIQTI